MAGKTTVISASLLEDRVPSLWWRHGRKRAWVSRSERVGATCVLSCSALVRSRGGPSHLLGDLTEHVFLHSSQKWAQK